MSTVEHEGATQRPAALTLLASERPRNVTWRSAAGLLFGDWGTSRLYVLGLAFLVAGQTSFWLILGMSILILVVGWAYTQICRIYSDGGGVYTAGRQRAAIIGVIGALLLFADYTVTASLSALDGFHYFGLGQSEAVAEEGAHPEPSGYKIVIPDDNPTPTTAKQVQAEQLWQWRSPGLWAIFSIVLIGVLNLLGPKHSAGFALVSAVGMIIITLLIVAFALPQIDWRHLDLGRLNQPVGDLWHGFVYIVLALSGVEAIANLTGVMRRPVYLTARKSIWVVAIEVALFNLILAAIMVATPITREAHKADMLAYLAGYYVGPAGEWAVRIIGGLLLLSATNTAVGALTGTIYVMSRDNELPRFFQRLNPFGAPWFATVVATAVPAGVLLLVHDLKALASMYAIGVVGAVAINCCITTFHPRLRRFYRKIAMFLLGLGLIAMWLTLAFTKWHATAFVAIVMVVGLTLRAITRHAAKRRPKASLLREAILEQLSPEAMAKPKVLIATAGSATMAAEAIEVAKTDGAALVVSFIREVALSYKVESRMTLYTDPAAQTMFVDFLDMGHRAGVPIIPMYDTGTNAAELIAETAAINGVAKVLIGTSRRGALHHIIKGSFQRRLESLLPPEIPVQVLNSPEPAPVVA